MGVVFISLQSKFWIFAPVLLLAFVRICLNVFIPVVGSLGLFWESLTKVADRSIFFSSVFLFFCCRCHSLGTFLAVECRTCIWGLLWVLIFPTPFCNCAILFASWGSGCGINGEGGGGGWTLKSQVNLNMLLPQYCRFRTEALLAPVYIGSLPKHWPSQ